MQLKSFFMFLTCSISVKVNQTLDHTLHFQSLVGKIKNDKEISVKIYTSISNKTINFLGKIIHVPIINNYNHKEEKCLNYDNFHEINDVNYNDF